MVATLSECAHVAADYYHIPEAVIERVSSQWGKGGGVGPMGIQPEWFPILARAGFDLEMVRKDACINVAAGAWILAWAGVRSSASGAPAPERFRPVPAKLSSDLDRCLVAAARRYDLPEILYRAILRTEGGRVGQIHQNQNGSYDMGPAQINSSNLSQLAKMGISRDQVINDGCLNIHIGAWILATELDGHTPDDPAEFWRRVGNYNSHTPRFNQVYQQRVWRNVGLAAR
jgi:Transglycosylase SLT domain